MKNTIKTIIVVLLLLVGYGFLIISSTGFFREINNTYPADGYSSTINLPGVEDIAISREDNFLVFSSDDRAARRDGKAYHSGLYLKYLDSDNSLILPLQVPKDFALYPHGISLIKIDSNTHRLLVVNHVSDSNQAISSEDVNTKHSIEEFLLTGVKLTHIKSHIAPDISSPNDVTAVDATAFYYSNDHGSKTGLGLMLEDYLGLKRSNVGYYDGKTYQEVADGIAYANGVSVDMDHNLLFVCSPRAFALLVYDIQDRNKPKLLSTIDCGTGVDNIEFDTDGKLWIGAHPKLLHFAAYAKGKEDLSPSEVITVDYRSPDEYEVKSVYLSDGLDMSGSTVAVPFGKDVYLGNVMDDHILVLEKDLLEL